MKKSSWMLLIGIVAIAAAFIGDAIVSNGILSFTDASDFGVWHYVAIVVAALLLVGGLVLVIVSRALHKKGK